jgi:hypothetical protein
MKSNDFCSACKGQVGMHEWYAAENGRGRSHQPAMLIAAAAVVLAFAPDRLVAAQPRDGQGRRRFRKCLM